MVIDGLRDVGNNKKNKRKVEEEKKIIRRVEEDFWVKFDWVLKIWWLASMDDVSCWNGKEKQGKKEKKRKKKTNSKNKLNEGSQLTFITYQIHLVYLPNLQKGENALKIPYAPSCD